MEKYVKIKISFKDKLNLLLFDLFPEKVFHLLQEIEKPIDYNNLVNKEYVDDKIEPIQDDQIEEEKIKFFENINEDVKTNF